MEILPEKIRIRYNDGKKMHSLDKYLTTVAISNSECLVTLSLVNWRDVYRREKISGKVYPERGPPSRGIEHTGPLPIPAVSAPNGTNFYQNPTTLQRRRQKKVTKIGMNFTSPIKITI